jgi:flagellar basal-body rod protein FlgF
MIRGLYTSGWSMLANSRKMDVISNNLANSSTNGFKKDTVVFESFPSVLTKRIYDTPSASNPTGKIGTMELGSDVGEVFTYYNQGQMLKTNNNFDLAIQGADTAFFTVGVTDENGNRKEYYTRDGAFVINQDQKLVTKDGYEVLGENGPIYLEGEQFSVGGDGSIIQNGREVGKLKLRNFADQAVLKKVGANLVEAPEDAENLKFTGLVAQGYLEQSNVNIVKEMVDMISVMRAYEANQKILQAQDGTLEKAVTEVGALR